jgi:signal transduction histidine kinase
MPFKYFATCVILGLLAIEIGIAQAIVISENTADEISINPYCNIYKNPKIGLANYLSVIKAPESDFVKNSIIQEINYDFYKPAGWCKFVVKNDSKSPKIILLKVHQARVDSVQLFVKKSDGVLLKYALSGHFLSIENRPYYSLHFTNKLSLKPHETLQCFLFTQRTFGRHAAVLSLHNEQKYQHYESLFIIFISIICGLIFLASLVGIVLCFFVFDKKYIYYSIYCLSYIPLLLSDTGFFHAFFKIANQDISNNINMITYYWIVGWHLLFTVVLLDSPVSKRWMNWLGFGTGYLFCAFALVLLLPVPALLRWVLSYLSYYVVFFVDAFILFAIYINLFQRRPIVYFYLAGFLITLVVASVLMLADLQLLEGINQKTDLFFITPFFEILCMVIGLGIHFSENVKQKLHSQQQLNEAQKEVLNIQENERNRIAQDLHDQVGNSLAALKNIVIHNKYAYNIEAEIDKILLDIRSISHDLMPVDFDKNNLPEIIEQTLIKFGNNPQISFDFEQTGHTVKLSSATELVLYRIVNELISNVIKHSKASQTMVQLVYQATSLVLMVEDNGIGIKNDQTFTSKGIGLQNIQHRCQYIQAKMSIESDTKGTLIIIEIPYHD